PQGLIEQNDAGLTIRDLVGDFSDLAAPNEQRRVRTIAPGGNMCNNPGAGAACQQEELIGMGGVVGINETDRDDQRAAGGGARTCQVKPGRTNEMPAGERGAAGVIG